MAEYQACAELNVEDVYSTSTNTLADLMNLQKNIQETLYFPALSEKMSQITGEQKEITWESLQTGKLRDLKTFIDWNEEAIRDEQREFAVALGGVDTLGQALWKPWKAKFVEAGERTLQDLTEKELLELQYEWIDQLHFFLNIGISIGMDAQRTMNLYFAKNQENRNRQQKVGGY